MIGLFAGSFDPIHKGHLDLIFRAGSLCSKLYIALGRNPGKSPLFETAERITLIEEECALLRQAIQGKATKTPQDQRFLECTLQVAVFDGLIVTFAQEVGATALIRGLRNGTDFDYEQQMALLNAKMAPGIETIMVPAADGVGGISSSYVRQIAKLGGPVQSFVGPATYERLQKRFDV